VTGGGTFDGIASRYERDSLAQRAAADHLLNLAGIQPHEDVLDVGCGTGHLVRRVRATTRGRVEGVDPSAPMIDVARRLAPDVRFTVSSAEEMPFEAEFDVLLSNSALQWFRDPARGLARMRAALRPGGRLALQAPARLDYCPNFVAAMDDVARDPETAATFARFRSPWFFLEAAGDYGALLARAGLTVRDVRIEALRSRVPPADVMTVFESAAVAAYLGQSCYDVPLSGEYVARARVIVRRAFERQVGSDGRVELVIHRVFALADAPPGG
jgi:trans-aconitate methyltransferase